MILIHRRIPLANNLLARAYEGPLRYYGQKSKRQEFASLIRENPLKFHLSHSFPYFLRHESAEDLEQGIESTRRIHKVHSLLSNWIGVLNGGRHFPKMIRKVH